MKSHEESGKVSIPFAQAERLYLSPFAELIGIKIDKLAKNYCRLCLTLDERCTNYYGGIHGGVLATLADNCMGMALRTAGLHPITVELTINYISRPSIGERLTVEGLMIHRGKTIILTECVIRSEDLNNVATARGIFLNRGKNAGDLVKK